MSDILIEQQHAVFSICLNRVEKHNAFDDSLITQLIDHLQTAINTPDVRSIVLKSHGKNFSAGADLNWMQRMVNYSEQENYQDSLELAKLMRLLNQSPKPTIAMVQGAAMGGGVGLVAACDMAIAATDASFCFSEVKLGLIPAVISPYVINAIGQRQALRYFVSAERFDAREAYSIGLVNQICAPNELEAITYDLANKIAANAPDSVRQSKTLVNTVAGQTINDELMQFTAEQIAKKRISQEGQHGLNAFLNKQKPSWNDYV